MKPKYVLKKYKCQYCEWRHDKLNKVKTHEEKYHGSFKKKVEHKKKATFTREPCKEDRKFPGKLKIFGTDNFMEIYYKWNDKTYDYDMFTNESKYGKDIKILWDNNNNMFKICNIKKLRRDWKNDKMS